MYIETMPEFLLWVIAVLLSTLIPNDRIDKYLEFLLGAILLVVVYLIPITSILNQVIVMPTF